MKKALLTAIGLFIVLGSCEKFGNNDKFDFRLRLVTNAPLPFGEKLTVEVEDVFSDYTYEMTLPNGKILPQTSFHYNKADATVNGWFKITARGSDGFFATDSAFVKVLPATVPCFPQLNSLDCPYKFNMNFNNIVQGRSGDSYAVQGKSSWGNFTVLFPGTTKPTEPATYLTDIIFNDPEEGKVRLYITSDQGHQYFMDEDQRVHLSKEGEKMYVTLCGIKLMNGADHELVTARLEF